MILNRHAITRGVLVVLVVLSTVGFAVGTPFVASTATAADSGPTYTEPFSDVWIGQTVTIQDDDLEGPVEILAGPPNTDDAESVTVKRVVDGRVSFDTSVLQDGEPYHIVDHGADASPSEFHETVFWAYEQDLNVTTARDTTVPGGEVPLTISSDRETFDLDVSASGLDADELASMFDPAADDALHGVTVDEGAGVVTLSIGLADGNGTVTTDFGGVDPGDYKFSFTVPDTHTSASLPIDVVDDSIGYSIVEAPAGDRGELINVTIDPEYTSSGAVVLGDRETVAFETAVEFVDTTHGEYDEITLQYNTYEHTRDNETHGWRVHPSNDEVRITDTWAIEPSDGNAFDHPLDPGEYPVATGEAWLEEYERLVSVSDAATFTIQEPSSPTGITTYTAPRGQDIESDGRKLTATEAIAHGDRLFASPDGVGLSGLIDAIDPAAGDDLGTALADAGIYLELEQSGSQLNDPGNPVWTTDQAAADGAADTYELAARATPLPTGPDDDLVVELSDDTASRSFDADERYTLTVRIESNSSFTTGGENVTESSSFWIESPALVWHEKSSSVGAMDRALVTGTTNVAPGSRIRVEATAPRQFRTVETAKVTEDGTFFTRLDLGGEPVGTEFEMVATHESIANFTTLDPSYETSLHDVIGAELVAPEDAPETVSIDATAPDVVAVGEEATLELTVDPSDSPIETVEYEVVVDGERIDQQRADVSGGSFNESYQLRTDSPRTINWQVTVDGQILSGTTIVEAPGVNDDSENVSGFGVAVALVALLSAAMLALRRQD